MQGTATTVEHAVEDAAEGTVKTVSKGGHWLLEELKSVVNGKSFIRWIVAALFALLFIVLIGKVNFKEMAKQAL